MAVYRSSEGTVYNLDHFALFDVIETKDPSCAWKANQMKHKASFMVLMLSIMLMIVHACADAHTAEVDIPDEGLKESILKELGKTDKDTLTKSDMKKITSITITNAKELTGLELAKSLETLVLVKCDVTDISEIETLSCLVYLTIIDVPIREINSVSDLNRLNSVLLHGTQVSDIEPIVFNENLGKGSMVRLDDNPLNYKSQYIFIPKLICRGVKVNFSPKSPLYDLNTDGRVSVLDMIPIGKAIAKGIRGKDIPEDVNHDEIVDVKDIRIVSNNLSQED